jgi:hypothetical protein
MAYLYQQIQNVSGLAGTTPYAKQADYYSKLGLGGKYTGSLQQNTQLLNYLKQPNYGLPQATPAPVAQSASPTMPTNPAQVDDYLNNYNQSVSNLQKLLQSPTKTDEEIRADIQKQLQPDMAMPEVPKLTELFDELRNKNGVPELEQVINELKGMEDEIVARRRQRLQYEEGQPVRMSVIGGRQGEINRQEAEEIDFIQRQISRKVEMVQGAYSVINMMMQLTQSDYNNSMQRYNQEFQQKMSMYQMFQSEKQQQINNAKDLVQLEFQEVQRQEQMARANLEIFMNTINENGMNYAQLDDATKLQMEKLSIQAGLGKDFLKNLASTDKLITSDTRQAGNTKYIDMVYRKPDGTMYVKSTKIGSSYSVSNSNPKSNEPTDKEVRGYMSSASKVLQSVDSNYQTTYDKNGKVTGIKKLDKATQGDRRMSENEMDEALEQLVREIGDRAIAERVFADAWRDGGYSVWYPK